MPLGRVSLEYILLSMAVVVAVDVEPRGGCAGNIGNDGNDGVDIHTFRCPTDYSRVSL